MSTQRDLFSEANTLKAEAMKVIEKAKAEDRELTADEKANNDKAFARCSVIAAQMAEEKKFAGLEFSKIENVTKVADSISAPREVFAKEDEADKLRQHKAEINEFMRTGRTDKFVISTTSGSSILLPSAVTAPMMARRPYNSIIAAIGAYGLSPLFTSSAETITIPLFDDTAQVGATLSDPITAADSAGDVSLTSGLITLTATSVYDSKTQWLTNTSLAALASTGGDNGFDLLSYVGPMLNKRVELAQDASWITTIITNSTVVSATTTTASPTAITFVEFMKWFHGLDFVYRTDGVFIMSDGLLNLIESLVDSNNRPLLSDATITGSVKSLKGCPVFLSKNLATPASTTVSGLFASAESLVPRIVTNSRLAVYTNQPSFSDQTGYRLFVNGGFGINPKGVQTLTMHA